MVRTMKLAENDEFEAYESISKINSILKIKVLTWLSENFTTTAFKRQRKII